MTTALLLYILPDFRTMLTQLVKHERIETTLTKAKALQGFAERMVTHAKRARDPSEFNARHHGYKVNNLLTTAEAISKLLGEIAVRYEGRFGGYTRVLKTRRRIGDGAIMAFIEFVDRSGELRPAKEARAPGRSQAPPRRIGLYDWRKVDHPRIYVKRDSDNKILATRVFSAAERPEFPEEQEAKIRARKEWLKKLRKEKLMRKEGYGTEWTIDWTGGKGPKE